MHMRTRKQASLASLSHVIKPDEGKMAAIPAMLSCQWLKSSPNGHRGIETISHGKAVLQVSYITFCSVSLGLIWLIGRRSDTGD